MRAGGRISPTSLMSKSLHRPNGFGEDEAVREAIKRDQELTSGVVQGRTHEEVMRAARRAIEEIRIKEMRNDK
jgi:hypothetical protein